MNKHYIVTNREVIPAKGRGRYLPANANQTEWIRADGKESATDNLRFGTYSFTDQNDQGSIHLFEDLDPNKEVQRDSSALNMAAGSYKVFSELHSVMKHKEAHKSDVLFFIHGFKSDLDNGLETVRRLHKEYVENPDSPIEHIVLFTWPAKSKLFQYRDDARDARISGYALGRGLQLLANFFDQYFISDNEFCNQRIHLMAHSMGNQVLEAMFAELNYAGTRIPDLFKETLLVCSDIDYDALESPRPLNNLIDICQRIHIYYHDNDRALMVSEKSKNAIRRLGRWGMKNTTIIPDMVFEADVSTITDDDGLINEVAHHWYYYNSATVVNDIIQVLNGGVSSFTDQY